MTGEYSVVHGSRTITYRLVRKKVKNVNLRVRPDATVVVSANPQVPLAFIEKLVRDRAQWILLNMDRLEEKAADTGPNELISGARVPYLGQQLLLQIIPAPERERVELEGNNLTIYTKNGADLSRPENLLDSWFRNRAAAVFSESLERVFPLVAAEGIARPSITVRRMKTRWGSCSWKKGKITLNSELLKTSLECIDYVVLHELAHFRHHRHDSAFYGFIEKYMPGWREHRLTLKRHHPGYS